MAGIESDKDNPGFKNIILQSTLDRGKKYNSEDRINHVKASYDLENGVMNVSILEEGKEKVKEKGYIYGKPIIPKIL